MLYPEKIIIAKISTFKNTAKQKTLKCCHSLIFFKNVVFKNHPLTFASWTQTMLVLKPKDMLVTGP